VDPKTVRKVLRPNARPVTVRRPSLLDPFRPLIRELAIEKELTSVRILEEIAAVGYLGRYTVVKEYVRTVRPKPLRRRPHLRFETAPGEQGQVDLSPYTVLLSGVPTDVVCFSFVLGFSRWQFIHFFLSADAHAVCYGHVLAFEEAGGVPREILYDQMKQVVIEVGRDEVIFHQLFEKLKHHYGFEAIVLEAGYPEGKGKVENPFKFVEGNFLAGRTFQDIDDVNRKAHAWLTDIARVRIHRTTQERPIDRLLQGRSALIPLAPTRFEAARVEVRLVGADFCVPWDTNRYSVPPRFVGRQAWVHGLEGRLSVHIDKQIVAEHPERDTKHKRFTLPEHEAEFRARSGHKKDVAERFEKLGRVAVSFAEGLREERHGAAAYHMQKIL
jgi:transposase